MSFEFFKLKSIDLENSLMRNPRVGSKNRPTSRTIDIGCTGIGTNDIYTGERNVSEDYLVQGAVKGDIIKASSAVFTINSKFVTNVEGINGLQPSENVTYGDIIRADGDINFYNVTGMGPSTEHPEWGTVVFLTDPNTTATGINSVQIRKIKLDSTHFEYIKGTPDENKFFYDKTHREWRYSGIQGFTGPLVANSTKSQYFEGDPVTLKFYKSYSSTAPDLTSVDTTATDPKQPYGVKVLENKLAVDTPEIYLSPVPYPDDDQNFRVYWGPQTDIELKTKDINYTVNYTMDPDYTSAKPPYKDRNVAYVKFLNQLTDTTQIDNIGLGFQGVFNLHEDPTTSATKQPKAITNIYPNAKGLQISGDPKEYAGEIIRVGNEVKQRSFDYNIEYDNGIVNFIKHNSLELDVPNVIYNQNLIWDGISVLKGVGVTGLVNPDRSNCVIPYGIVGLTGIDGPVFFEDVDTNALVEGTDYLISYNSGAIKLNKSLKSNECVLVSYFVEGEDVVSEPLNLNSLRTRQYPIIESSVSIKKVYSNTSTATSGIKILVEGVDFQVFYLTGKIILLNPSITENMSSLQISYTPFSQVQCILQPIANDPKLYRITILDDAMSVVDPFNLKFKIDNPTVSIPVVDPFGELPTTFDSSIISNSLISVKGLGEPGYGLDNLTEQQMFALGMTGLEFLGLDKKLGKTPEEFYAIGITGVIELGLTPDATLNYDITNYTYDDSSKQLTLDTTINAGKPKPDINDLILASYSYVADILPYAPIQTIFPVLNQTENTVLIEGFDKTDVIHQGMTFRIDNTDPKNSYYFLVSSCVYDGLNTTITFKGSFAEDIRNPSFYLFDDIVQWTPLPAGASIDSSSTMGSDTITIKGSALKSLELLRPKTLMMVDDTDIYEIMTTTVVNNETLDVKIFPNLLKEYPGNIKISNPVYQVGDTTVNSDYPIITDPPHPAFTIRFVVPVNAIYGTATIFIDGEKIVLTEIVDEQTQVYNYLFSDYSSINDLAQAIKNTASTLNPAVYQYYPFTLLSSEGVEQYYLGTGFWSANLVLPFEQDAPVIIPTEGYTVTISQEVFRYILIKAFKNANSFFVERKDRTDYFAKGNLLTFISKSTGDISFYEVSDVALTQETISKTLTYTHTKVSFKDSFRENMIAPYMYKYDRVNWIEVIDSFTVDYVNSKIEIQTDTVFYKKGALLKFNNGFIYRIIDRALTGTAVTLTLSPSISASLNNIISLSVSDMPIYLNEVSPQPYFIINYTVPEGYSGGATVEVNGDNLIITEKLAGFAPTVRTVPIPYNKNHLSNLNNLFQFGDALDRLTFTIAGVNPVEVDTSAYKDLFVAGGKDLNLVPTQTSLPAAVPVSRPIMKITYTSPDGTTDSDVFIPADGSSTIQIREWKKSNKDATTVTNIVSYSNVTIAAVIASINSLQSIITGDTPWTVIDTDFDTYFEVTKPTYYTIIPFANQDPVQDRVLLSTNPCPVQVTENPEFWYAVGILNRNVLVSGTDYNIEGTQVVLSNSIQVSERYEVSYLGIDDLSNFEGDVIRATCRYFSSIPAGYQINVYMDYLNPDQYYIQKLTERKFLEIVTVPQIQDILQQAGNSAGMGNSSGSDDVAQNYQGGLVDLYYFLKDEQIKQQIYLKVFQWYKQRLRNFAAEAQVIMGVKYGHSNYVGINEAGQFTMQDQYVEDINYTLTKTTDFDQIKNGFSKFFPVEYDGSAPQKYPRFTDTYQPYNEVFCFNIEYHDANDKIISKEGRVVSTNPYWADVPAQYGNVNGSNLDFDILPYNQTSSVISDGTMYFIPYDQEEKHFKVTDESYKFLRRMSPGDSLQLLGFQNTYTVGKIENKPALAQNVVPIQYVVNGVSIPMTYDGHAPTTAAPNPTVGIFPVYGTYIEDLNIRRYAKEGDPYPLGTPVLRDKPGNEGNVTGLGYKVVKPTPAYDRLILDSGKFFTESGVQTFVVKQVSGVWTYTYYIRDFFGNPVHAHTYTLDELEMNLPKEGQNIIVTRGANKDFPVIFPAWDDEFNLGTKIVGSRIIDQRTGTDTIRKTFSFSDLFDIFDDEDKFFTVYEGTYDDLSGLWLPKNTVQVNLKYLNFFDERNVSRVVDSVKYNVSGTKYPLFFPPFVLKISDIYKKRDGLGTDKFFYVSFDKYYDANLSGGYGESIVMRSRDRNSWVMFGVTSDTSNTPPVTPEYGFSSPDVYTNFFYPNNLYLRLLIEKQMWLTEFNIIKDLFDTNNKLKRAFKINTQDVAVTEPALSEFFSFLKQVAVESPLGNVKTEIERYVEHLRFLLDQSDTAHPYLVDNTSGPLYRTRMEDQPISLPIQKSYNQAGVAQGAYTAFQNEAFYNYALNNYYYSRWVSEYAKWALSLEEGTIFQKDARNKFQALFEIDVGFNSFPAIKIITVDQGPQPAFTVSNARYRVQYNILATADTSADEYDDATLYIAYQVSGDLTDTIKAFYLKSYSTLQSLVDAINTQCVHPTLGNKIISATCIFDYYPYRNYSPRWILRTYRNVVNNDANGTDLTTGNDGWTVLTTDPAAPDDRVFVCNVMDHRQYDARVFFKNRQDFNSDFLSINGTNYHFFPYYVPTDGKEILGFDKEGPIPVAGSWAKDTFDPTGRTGIDYTTEFNVMSINPALPSDTFIRYEFLDYVRGPEQLPGEETPRNPSFEKSQVDLASIGYDETTRTLLEKYPSLTGPFDSFTETGIDNSNFETLLSWSGEAQGVTAIQPPETEIIRDLQIELMSEDFNTPGKFNKIFFTFNLRQYPTINELVDALNNNKYTIVLNPDGMTYTAQLSTGAAGSTYFNATLVGSPEIQGSMKTVDLVTNYVRQEVFVAKHVRYAIQNTYVSQSYGETGIPQVVPREETLNKSYPIGWQLREQSSLSNDTVLNFRIDPRTYSPSYSYRFVPDKPDAARTNTFLSQKKDILAFDLYSWDTNAQYKIKNNVLFLRSASIPEMQIPLYKTINLDTTIDHPEETYQLIDIIRLINNNSLCNKKFFADLRFGRLFKSDYQYTYFPDTDIWAGNNGWVNVVAPESLDYLYLSQDSVFSVYSEGSNFDYQVSPYPATFDTDTIYNTNSLALSADTRAINLSINETDYNFISAYYAVNETAFTMGLTGSYDIDIDGSVTGAFSSLPTMQDVATYINSSSAFTASVVAGMETVVSTNLVEPSVPTLPGTLIASFTQDVPNSVSFNLATHTSMSSLVNAIQSYTVTPIHGVPIAGRHVFSATSAGYTGISMDIADGTGPLTVTPIILFTGSLPIKSVINLSLAPTDSNYSITSASYSKVGNNFTLNYTVHYVFNTIAAINVGMKPGFSGRFYSVVPGYITLGYTQHITDTFGFEINLLTATSLNDVISEINTRPENFPAVGKPFFVASLSWIDGTANSISLLDTGGSKSITSTGVYVRMRGEVSFTLSASRTIADLVKEINDTSYGTGFAVDITTPDYIGYQSMRTDLLIPTNGEVPVPTDNFIKADFRNVRAVNVLNMSHTTQANGAIIGPAAERCKAAIDVNTISFTKNTVAIANLGTNPVSPYIGDTYEYDSLNNKNISNLLASAMDLDGFLNTSSSDPNFSYANGILKMDVALLPIQGINYGKLRLRNDRVVTDPTKAGEINTIDLITNDPENLNTHVYFGFLGDIRFYQISDYDLWKQYVLIKRRLGIPWNSTDTDHYVSNDLYNFSNYEYTLNTVDNGKFLYYLKYTRFKELADSLNFEDLYNNKYLWLFLKFHKEIGCDQKILALQKKIKEDNQKAKLLQ